MSRNFYKSLSIFLLVVIFLGIVVIAITLSDNVLISNKEYETLLEEEEILSAIDKEIVESISNNSYVEKELSEFETIKRLIMDQFQSYPNIIFYKSFISEEKMTAQYFVVYEGIDEDYSKNKQEIQAEVNELCLKIKKEWVLWEYPDITVIIDVAGEDEDFTYMESENGETSFDCNEKQREL